jgi:hypothetical protein
LFAVEVVPFWQVNKEGKGSMVLLMLSSPKRVVSNLAERVTATLYPHANQ